MERWISKLLGLEEGLLGSASSWGIELGQSVAVFAVIALLLAVGVVWIYLHEGLGSARILRTVLIGLRAVAILLVLALLFEPILAIEKLEDRRPAVLFLVDDSMSMSIPGNEYASPQRRAEVLSLLTDQPGLSPEAVTGALEERLRGASRLDLAGAILRSKALGWIDRLKGTYRLQLLTASNALKPLGDADAQGKLPPLPEKAEGRTSRLGDALREILQSTRGQQVAGIVLLSDGQSNSGEHPLEPARFAGRRKPDAIPVYCVGIGSDEEPRDVEVFSVQAPTDVIQSEEPFEMRVTVRSKACAGKDVKVTLLKGETPVDTKSLSLTDAPGGQEILFEDKPTERGPFRYVFRLEGLPEGDLIAENNVFIHTVNVTDKKFRVLYVEGRPRFEYHKIEALLDRNEDIYEYSVLLLSAELQWSQPAHPESKRLKGFPDKAEELIENYDLVILGDVRPDDPFLPKSFDETIYEFVTKGGGALVMVAGSIYNPLAYRGTKIEQLLPFHLDTTAQRIGAIRNPFPVKVNPQERSHPLVQLTAEPDANLRIWEEQFRPYWHWHIDEPLPQARILLQHGTHQILKGKEAQAAKPCPLMLLVRSGAGQSLFISLDETWRWPRGIPEGSPSHPFNRFWNQAIKYLASEKLTRGGKSAILRPDREEYPIGAQVIVTLETIDKAVFPPLQREVKVQVTPPSGIPVSRVLKREGEGASYVGTFPADQKGRHDLKVLSEKGDELAAASYEVKEFTAEFAAPRMNREVLSEIAAASGGKFLELAELKELPDLVGSRTRRVTRPVANRLMDAPLVFLLFCGAILAEWVLRKRFRLM